MANAAAANSAQNEPCLDNCIDSAREPNLVDINDINDDDVSDGVTVFAKDDRGYSALHVAALFEQTQMVELLVDLGALVNAADHYGRTALHLACMRGGQKAVSK